MMKPLGIYVHIPFCVRRCPYCGFYSDAIGACTGGRGEAEHNINEYFRILKEELELRSENSGASYFVDSVYFGGGTPSLAEPELIVGMIDSIASLYKVADDCEISMEANPGTLAGLHSMTGGIDCYEGGRSRSADEVSRLKAYKAAGVDRLSLGVQSLDDSVLKTLGRIHDADEARRAFDAVREAEFDNVSVDLMFGVPGQTEAIWESTVNEIVSMLPEHVSFYSLQIEEGTRFYQDYKMGDMVTVTDEEDRRMYHSAIQILRDSGYRQYEISNAALPGRECRHNLKYWTFQDYLGIGASASSFMNGVRKTDPGAGYLDFAAQGFPDQGLAENHKNSDFDNAADYMITGLRLAEGVSESDFRSKFTKNIWEVFPDAAEELKKFIDNGDIIKEDGRLYISEKGFDISNRIMELFV